ncbi:MAG TPA: response regulator, partial [Chloroflexia bacterium]|nr:response regulator [Chloroflexia bacterium]
KSYELNSLVQQAIENNQGLEVQYGIQFELVETLSGPKVNVDHDRMMQVLANLLSNAAKFSPNGEKVEVRIARQRDRKLRVSIKDHGPGIPPEFQPRIFQKFAQADSSDSRQKGGTGLGLNITKALIERFGGQIGFETEFNRGSVFYFDLPEYKEAEEATVNSLQPVYEPGILICEDDHDVAALLSLVLSQHHFKTDIAYTVTQARKLLKENKYDAMTLDIMLPDQDGISFLRELRSQQETLYLPIIVVSVKAETSRQELNGNALAVIDWIEKPLNQERLVSAVTQATRQLKSKTSFPRILHIEDDPDIIEIVKIMLNGIAEVISVTTGEEARKTLELNNFDLVLLDLELPDCSGLELLPLIQSHSNLPVVVFSAQEMSQDLAREVAAALVKSKTSNIELLNVIKSLVTSEKGDLLQTQAPQK